MKPHAAILLLALAGCATPTPPPAPVATNGQAANWPAEFWLAASNAARNLPPMPVVTKPVPPTPPAPSGFSVLRVAAPAFVVPITETNIPQPTSLLRFGWDVVTGVDGYILHFGTRSGRYSRAVTNEMTSTEATATGLDFTQPWFFAVAAFVTNAAPDIHCVTRGSTAFCWTNWITESDPSPEIVWIDATMRPFIAQAGSNVTVTGYGALGNHYTVYAGTEPGLCTNAAFETDGTNGPWTFQTNGAGAGYFRTEVTTP